MRKGRFIFLALAFACSREPELASGHILIRDPAGTVRRELRATSYGYFMPPKGPRIHVTGQTVDAGEVRIEGGVLSVGGTARLVVERKNGQVAFYLPTRAPVGTLASHKGNTWAYDPGGTPLGAVHSEQGRIVLLDREGASKGYVESLSEGGAAALLLGPAFSELEKLALAIYLSRS